MDWRLVVAVVHTTEWRCVGPVATITPAGLPGWGPRSARRSVIVWRLVLTRSLCLVTAS
jgi:hypothetical protein